MTEAEMWLQQVSREESSPAVRQPVWQVVPEEPQPQAAGAAAARPAMPPASAPELMPEDLQLLDSRQHCPFLLGLKSFGKTESECLSICSRGLLAQMQHLGV